MKINYLTGLYYADDRDSQETVFVLYCYDSAGFHGGRQYFRAVPRYPDEEITAAEAMRRCEETLAQGNEVRVTNGGDELVFHAIGKTVHYPNSGNFWDELK